MRGRACRVRIAVASLAMVALVWTGVVVAQAAAPDQQGYWWRLNGGGLGGTSPHVSDGGLWVAADPLGAQAVSALRLRVPDSHEVRTVALVEDSRTGTPALLACPVTADWSPPDNDPGGWEERPETSCDRGVPGTEGSGDVITWVFPVGPLVDNGVLDIAIVPAPDANFSITFDSLDERTIVTEHQDESSFDFLASTTTRPESTTQAATPPTTQGTAAPPNRSTPTDTSPPAAAPQPTSTPMEAALSTTTTVQPIAAGPVDVLDDGGSRAPVVLLLVLAVIGTWAWRTRQVVRASDTHVLAGEPFAMGAPTLTAEGLLEGEGDS